VLMCKIHSADLRKVSRACFCGHGDDFSIPQRLQIISFYSKNNYIHQCTKFILFWNVTLHVSDDLSVHHQEFKTVHIATGICQTDTAVCLLAGSGKQTAVSV